MGLLEGLMAHNLFLKKDVGISRGVGVCSAESGKRSWFVWDVGGSDGVKSHIPNVPILPCHTSGGEASWQQWYNKKNTYLLESLLTFCYSHQAFRSFCVPAAWYHCWVPLTGLRHLPREARCQWCPNNALRIRKEMGVKGSMTKSEMRFFCGFFFLFLIKNFIFYFTKEIISSQ